MHHKTRKIILLFGFVFQTWALICFKINANAFICSMWYWHHGWLIASIHSWWKRERTETCPTFSYSLFSCGECFTIRYGLPSLVTKQPKGLTGLSIRVSNSIKLIENATGRSLSLPLLITYHACMWIILVAWYLMHKYLFVCHSIYKTKFTN